MNWGKMWDKAREWGKGLRTYVGITLTTVVSPAIQDANVHIQIGPVEIPVAKLVDVLGGMLMGVGVSGKMQTYQQARAAGHSRTSAASQAAFQGPLFDSMKIPFRGGAKIPPINTPDSGTNKE